MLIFIFYFILLLSLFIIEMLSVASTKLCHFLIFSIGKKKNDLKLHTVDVMLIAQIEKFIITINLPFTGEEKKKRKEKYFSIFIFLSSTKYSFRLRN